MTRWVSLAALVLLAGGCTGTEAGPAVPIDPAVMYGQMCARCHGNDGHGDPQMKQTMPTLRSFSSAETRARTNEQLETAIMAGKNQMPGFGQSLSMPKIQSLTGYVRKLGGK